MQPVIKAIEIYVIYKNPSDYPGSFVVRRWCGDRADLKPIIITSELLSARSRIPDDCVNIGRQDNDDPAILECWI